MTDQEFSDLIAKSSSKNRIIAIFFLIFGLGIITALIAGPVTTTTQKVILGILSGILLLCGVILIVISNKALSQIKAGTHPLLNGDPSYVLWFHEQVTTVNNAPATAHQIWIYNKNNKNTVISVKKTHVQSALQYLAAKFPNALMGYSDENKRLYKQRIPS